MEVCSLKFLKFVECVCVDIMDQSISLSVLQYVFQCSFSACVCERVTRCNDYGPLHNTIL